MVKYRMNRLFDPRSHRCVAVAIDHGAFNDMAFLAGIESMPAAIGTIVKAGADALLLAPGTAGLLQEHAGRNKPQLVLRADVSNGFHDILPEHVYCHMFDAVVELAVRLDAACMCINLIDVPGHPELNSDCVRNLMNVKRFCEQAGMPLMVEALALKPAGPAGAYSGDLALDKVLPIVRQGAELGADIIKADVTDNLDDYHRVVEAVHVPILVRGGGRMPDRKILDMTEKLVRQNVGGIIYGRNIIQHEKPGAMTQAFKSIVHENGTAEQAFARLQS